jgi:aarF domain-containing kinase
MILKLSDLQRSLDQSLATTHGQSRIFVIVARYCAKAVWDSDYSTFRSTHLSFRSFTAFIGSWWNYAYWTTTLRIVEMGMDTRARMVKMGLWVKGLSNGGLSVANASAAGLA